MTKRPSGATRPAPAPTPTPTPGLAGRRVEKKSTGIGGFDDITRGGLPENRLTAIIGGPGAGKTVFAVQNLVNRLHLHQEKGIFVTFEEPIDSIRQNMNAFDWPEVWAAGEGIGFIDARVPIEAVIAGAFDLMGLLAGLSALVAEMGAANVVFDGIDMLLSSLRDERLERQELARLDDWIRAERVTAVLTIKGFGISDRDQRRSDTLQYITDCVIVLDTTFAETTSSRHLRVVKYRGSGFAANPVPVVIGATGFDIVAFKTVRTEYPTFKDRVSSGVARLDDLLEGGYLRGSSVLVSGSPGTSKTSISASFAAAACARGEVALFVSFDESAAQIITNMQSIGLDLAPYVAAGTLHMVSLLSRGQSPEEHYVEIRMQIGACRPSCVVIDPLSSLLRSAYPFTDMISECIVDHAKSLGITLLCTSLLDEVSGDQELSASKISTIADTWMHVSYLAQDGERNRALTIIKSRGTGHSNQVRELVLGRTGVNLVDVYVAEGQVLMGSARAQAEAEAERQRVLEQAAYEHARMVVEHDIADLQALAGAAERDVKFKQAEGDFLAKAEGERAARERADATTRLTLRLPGDSSQAVLLPARHRRKIK